MPSIYATHRATFKERNMNQTNGISIPLADVMAKPDAAAPGALNFNCPPEDHVLIAGIVDRLRDMLRERDPARALQFDPLLIAMDLTSLHCNGTPLKLRQLLMCDASDFRNDLITIYLHINRKTGQLPDFAKKRLRFVL